MIKHYSYNELGHANHGWLDARHHFSFGGYYNPQRMGFGTLRVINDDVIKAGSGFDTHPHQNMEIITYVRQGAITHRDSNGNVGRTEAGDVQVMSAGEGIYHSEHNLESEDTHLYQIWIEPDKLGIEPSWAAHEFPSQMTSEKLELLVAPYGNTTAPLHIHQDAYIYAGRLKQDAELAQTIKHQAYLLVSQGSIEVDGIKASKGGAFEVSNIDKLQLKCLSDAQILVIDAPV